MFLFHFPAIKIDETTLLPVETKGKLADRLVVLEKLKVTVDWYLGLPFSLPIIEHYMRFLIVYTVVSLLENPYSHKNALILGFIGVSRYHTSNIRPTLFLCNS